ncbi:hypothetical protein GQ53DRAFT_666527, partial [Thozetella sp. PMI_491]
GDIIINSRNQAALRAIYLPKQQSAQHIIRQLYTTVQDLQRRKNILVATTWNLEQGKRSLQLVKKEVKAVTATLYNRQPLCRAKATALRQAVVDLQPSKLLDKVGAFLRRINRALPEKYISVIYDTLTKVEARILEQL